jgi:SNF2 family DNA or RNA helicase
MASVCELRLTGRVRSIHGAAFLDLTEACLSLCGVACFRFDGDLGHAANMNTLGEFKSYGRNSPSSSDGAHGSGCGGRCCLLATVHSGGVGLNIIEASTVIFCDRWPK